MEPITVTVTEAHLAEFERRWNALDEGGGYDETKDRATALALKEALQARGITAEVSVHVYDEEPARIYIGDHFCIAPDIVQEREYNGGTGPFEFTLFGDEAWAIHVPHSQVEAVLNGAPRRVYTAYVTGDNALHDDLESAVHSADAAEAEGMSGRVDLVTLQEIAREPVDPGAGPGNGTGR